MQKNGPIFWLPEVSIPQIDLANDPDPAGAVTDALANVGFMTVTNCGVDLDLLADAYRASLDFFTGPETVKRRCAYLSAEENFGYQGLQEENLDPGAPADLKETFTMRNVLNRPLPAERWPSPAFSDLMHALFANVLDAGFKLQRVLAAALDLDDSFFVRVHSGENVTLRLLYYPAGGVDAVASGQMGAGAHTDYGLLTLLFQDNTGGLQVRDADDKWVDVTPVAGSVVINSGDLLERWSNGRYRSTLHRVQPKIGASERLSIAMFIDPDSDTRVEALPSCVDADHPPRFPPVLAGEHLQEKLDASHKDRFK